MRFRYRYLFLSLCVLLAASFTSCYDNDEGCESAPASCHDTEYPTGTLTIKLTINHENPTVTVKLYRGSTIEHGTLIETIPAVNSEITRTMLSTGHYAAEAEYKYGSKKIITIDGDSISHDSTDYCDKTCYELDNGELNLRLDLDTLHGKDDFCFIATAAFGSPMERHVRVLREFRDDVLLRSDAGRAFVRAYYRVSPPLAGYIARHDVLRAAVRGALYPVVFMITWPFAALAFAGGFAASCAFFIRRRRGA